MLKTHFKEGDINEGLVLMIGWFNFQENIVVLISRLNELKWEDFFPDFIKAPPLHLTAGDCAIKLSVHKLCLRHQTPFELGLLISYALHFHVFNSTDYLKAIRATHLFLGLNQNFTELKIGNKSFF